MRKARGKVAVTGGGQKCPLWREPKNFGFGGHALIRGGRVYPLMGMVSQATHTPDIGQPSSNSLLDSRKSKLWPGGGWSSEFQTMSCCVDFSTATNQWGGMGGGS